MFRRPPEKTLDIYIEPDDPAANADNMIANVRESSCTKLTIYGIQSPEWAAGTLRRIRGVKAVIDFGNAQTFDQQTLYALKVIYSPDIIKDTANLMQQIGRIATILRHCDHL